LRSVENGENQQVYFPLHFLQSLLTNLLAYFFYEFKIAVDSSITPSAVTGDCISQKTLYFHRTSVKQGGDLYFGEMIPAVWRV